MEKVTAEAKDLVATEQERARREFEQISRQFKAATVAAIAVLSAGIGFYRIVEGFGWVDAFYFCVVTLATVGYGDIVPTTPSGKIFTSFYILIGFGLIAAFATTLSKHVMARRKYRTITHQKTIVGTIADFIRGRF